MHPHRSGVIALSAPRVVLGPLLAAFASLITQHAFASDVASLSDAVRIEYRASDPDVPDSIRFHMFSRTLASLNDKDPAWAIRHVRHGMGFDSSEEAETLLDIFLDAWRLYQSDYAAAAKRLTCPELNYPVDRQIYEAFDALDDAKVALMLKYLGHVRAQIGAQQSAKLDGWLKDSNNGMSFVYTQYDHERSYKLTGTEPNQRRAFFCERLATRSEQ